MKTLRQIRKEIDGTRSFGISDSGDLEKIRVRTITTPAQRMREKTEDNMKPIKFTWQDYENRVEELSLELDIPISDAQALVDLELEARGIELLPEP